MSEGKPLLWVVGGPNGAGKTTYYDEIITPRFASEFVNADRIAVARWPEDPASHAYDAAALAQKRRQALLDKGESFVAETVFSHRSKIELMEQARALGYTVWLTFVCVESADLALRRVRERVRDGGHAVPAAKIRARYRRIEKHAATGVAAADRAFIVDNSRPDAPLRVVMLYHSGTIRFRANPCPAWCERMFPSTAVVC